MKTKITFDFFTFRLLVAIAFLSGTIPAPAREGPLNVLVIFAHPDEGEIYAGGIANLYTRLGHRVKFLSLTNGDAGHWSMDPVALAKRRYQEAMEAKRILGLAEYEILDYHDGKLKNAPEIQQIVASRIEEWKADVVFLFYPITAVPGGHNDNMQAGEIARDAAVLLKLEHMPTFLYMRDFFTTGFSHIPDVAVDIEEVWETKLQALKAHESQVVEYNPHADGILEEVLGSPEKREQYLFYNAYPYSRVTPDIRITLGKWYGQEAAKNIQWAEAFEFSDFGRQLDNAAIAELFPMLGKVLTVPGAAGWFDTGIDLQTGQVVMIRAEGEVVWKKDSYAFCGPAGASPYTACSEQPVPGSGSGALIGRIGAPANSVFFIGVNLSMKACNAGRLYLGINDNNVKDNAGFFDVWIRLLKMEQP
jgi:LmbE family N-acetylglucosaminyl deacetylase